MSASFFPSLARHHLFRAIPILPLLPILPILPILPLLPILPILALLPLLPFPALSLSLSPLPPSFRQSILTWGLFRACFFASFLSGEETDQKGENSHLALFTQFNSVLNAECCCGCQQLVSEKTNNHSCLNCKKLVRTSYICFFNHNEEQTGNNGYCTQPDCKKAWNDKFGTKESTSDTKGKKRKSDAFEKG